MSEDLSPEERINRKREEHRQGIKARETADLKTVMTTPEGRRVVMRILEEGRAFGSCFDQNAIQMAYKEGQRDIALFLLKDLEADHQAQYLQMVREAKTLKHNDKLKLKSIIEGDSNE